MEIYALPSFELTFEGYCQAVTAYVLTATPDIIGWIAVVNALLASGELVSEPARTPQQTCYRLLGMRNAAVAIGLFDLQCQLNFLPPELK